MALPITITDAGRAEIINAQNTGTGPVTITEIGFGTGQYTPTKTRTALQAQVKRVSSIAGQAVAADTIHVMAMDESSAAYNVGEFGLFSDKGTLIAVYSQPAASGWIIQKAGPSTLLLATDIILESLDANSITFGDISFINPPATTTVQGVVELATPEETQTGTDASRAVTPAGLKSLTGTTNRAGLVQLNNTLTSTSTAQALTAAQGKKLQDEKQPVNDLLTSFGSNNGWGIGSERIETQVNLNDYKTGGKSITPAAGLVNLPPGWVQGRHVIDVTGSINYAVQVIHGAGSNAGRTAIRTWNGTSWGAWQEVWHAGNLVKQTDANDVTAGAVLLNGAHGWGSSEPTYVTDANLERVVGVKSGSGGSAANFPAGATTQYGPLLTLARGRAVLCQLAMYGAEAIDAELYVRGSNNTGATWGDWRKVFHSGNVSTFAQTLLDDVNAADARQTLGAAPLASPALTGTPTAPTAAVATNSTQIATTAFVKAVVASVIDSSPAALDTLNELAAALGNDPNFATTMLNALALKAPLASPVLTGTPTAPTRAAADNGDSIANTAFVKAALASFGIGGLSVSTEANLNRYVVGGAFVTPAAGLSPLPPGWSQGRHVLLVGGGGSSYTMQILMGESANTSKIAVRFFSGTSYTTWQEVWHAGNLIKQTSVSDTTPGAVLINGAHGLGSSEPEYVTNPNLERVVGIKGGNGSDATNFPAGSTTQYGPLLTLARGGSVLCQLAMYGAATIDAELYVRGSNNGGGTWGGWRKVFHSGNVSGFAQTLLDDVDAAAARKTLGVTVADGGLGYGQTWQDVTASRAWATTYTNTTGKPIQVSVVAADTVSGQLSVQLTVNGLVVARHYQGSNMEATASAIVPPGGTYRVDRQDTNDAIRVWAELR